MDRRTLLGAGLAAALSSRHWPIQWCRAMACCPPIRRKISRCGPARRRAGRSCACRPSASPIMNRPICTPSDRAVDQVGVPVMNVLRADRPDGSAMILAPGGGYSREMLDFEGMDVARHFNGAGVTCFMLRYRLPGEGWQTAAMCRCRMPSAPCGWCAPMRRLTASIRRASASWAFRPAAMSPAPSPRASPPRSMTPVDAADSADARPTFSVPMYPVVTMGPGLHQGSRDKLLGFDPSPEHDRRLFLREACAGRYAAHLYGAGRRRHDGAADAQCGCLLLRRCCAAKVPAEMHMFEAGGHGFGIARTQGKPTSAWPGLLLRWGASHGFFKSRLGASRYAPRRAKSSASRSTVIPASARGACSLRWRRNSRAPGRPL